MLHLYRNQLTDSADWYWLTGFYMRGLTGLSYRG